MAHKDRIGLLTVLLLALTCSSLCQADVIWDNRGPDGWYPQALSSERDTMIPASWSADDFVLIPGGTIETINALMYIRPYSAHPDGADYQILDDRFRIVTGDDGVSAEVEEIWCCDFTGGGVFQVTIRVDPIELPAGHYYCAIRLVGTGPDCNCQYFLFRTDAGVRGWTEGYFQSDFFGYPAWTPVSEVTGDSFDFSFWLTGQLSQPDCENIHKVRARSHCEKQKVKARVRTDLPEGTELALTLDGRRPKTVTIDHRGRAKVRWKNADGGEVCVGGCENICATAPPCSG